MVEVITWVLLIAIAYGCGKWADSKGYSFWAWFFGGSAIGAIVIACLPKISDLEEEKRDKQINTGNTIGIVLAVASFVWGFARGI